MQDIDYMKKVYQLAAKGKGKTSPNPMVGALIVKKGKIIAEGWHKKCGKDHAEVIALKKAGNLSAGATLYVSLEPCFHIGRTSPCVDLIIEKNIKEVVIGMKDPNPLTNGKSIAKLRRSGIKVRVGIMKKEFEDLNEVFIKYIKAQTPFVVGKIAQSIDGKIACSTGHSKWITSYATRQYARNVRNEFDAILVGINTILKDNPELNADRKSKRIKKIILDSTLKIPLNAKMFENTISADCIIATTKKANKKKCGLLRNKGVNVVFCPLKQQKVDLKWLLKRLAEQEISSILFEGGAHVIGSGIEEKLIDKMHIYIAPKIIGDASALDSVIGMKTLYVDQSIMLKDMSTTEIGQDVLIKGYVKYSS